MEEQLIRKIKGGLMGIKMKTKQPKDVAVLLNKLKLVNKLMYEDLFSSQCGFESRVDYTWFPCFGNI